MLSATSHIELEFLTKFPNISQFQNRLILLYQMVPLQSSSDIGQKMKTFFVPYEKAGTTIGDFIVCHTTFGGIGYVAEQNKMETEGRQSS